MNSLSIIIPVYNVDQFLHTCIDSIILQGLKDFEIILVDDGSTDSSGTICDEYASKYSEIRVFHQENKGLSAARNKALREARGEYILFLDSDDFLVPNTILLLLHQAKNNNLDILEFNSTFVKEDAIESPSICKEEYEHKTLKVYNGYDYIANHNYNGQVWCFIIKKSILKDNNIFFPEGHVLEDAAFNMQIILYASRIAFLPVIAHCYRIRESSIMHNKNEDHQKNILEDFIIAANNINLIIKDKKEEMSNECYERCCTRRDNYLFFGAIRALRLGVVDSYFEKARSRSLYPFPRLGKRDYPSSRYTILHWCLMKPCIWKTLNNLYRLTK